MSEVLYYDSLRRALTTGSQEWAVQLLDNPPFSTGELELRTNWEGVHWLGHDWGEHLPRILEGYTLETPSRALRNLADPCWIPKDKEVAVCETVLASRLFLPVLPLIPQNAERDYTLREYLTAAWLTGIKSPKIIEHMVGSIERLHPVYWRADGFRSERKSLQPVIEKFGLPHLKVGTLLEILTNTPKAVELLKPLLPPNRLPRLCELLATQTSFAKSRGLDERWFDEYLARKLAEPRSNSKLLVFAHGAGMIDDGILAEQLKKASGGIADKLRMKLERQRVLAQQQDPDPVMDSDLDLA